MSIQAKLYIEDRIINILWFSFSLSQKTDYNGHPSSKPTGGIFKIAFETTKDELFFLWMINNTMKNVKIVLSPSSIDGKSRTIELFDVYCLVHRENFDGVNNKPMSTYIEISPAIMIDSGVKIFEKYWKITDFSMQNIAPTVINNEEEPNFITHHFENRLGQILKEEKIKIGDEISLIIESVDAEGRSVTIDLDNELLDYEYKGKRVENDMLKNITLTGNITRIKLKAIKQKN